MSNWEWVTLDQLGSLERGNPWNEKYSISSDKHEGIPFVDCGIISQSKLHILGDKFYNPKHLPSKIKIFKKNTIVFVGWGFTAGNSALLKCNAYLSNNVYAFLFFFKNFRSPIY